MANTRSLDLELSSSQYAYITDASQTGLDITGDISIEAWIKLEQLPSTAGTRFVIANKGFWGTDNQFGYYLYIDESSNKLGFFYTSSLTGASATQYTSNTAFAGGDVGVWKHVAVTADVSAATMDFYIDASVTTDNLIQNGSTSIANNAGDFSLGARRSSGSYTNFFDGLIDEVRIWSDIRTSGEISANYQKELKGNEANLQAYWKLNNNYTDSTSNGNDLTASGSPVFSTDIPFIGANSGIFLSF